MPAPLPAVSLSWRGDLPWSPERDAAWGWAQPTRALCEERFLRAHGFAAAGATAPGRWTGEPMLRPDAAAWRRDPARAAGDADEPHDWSDDAGTDDADAPPRRWILGEIGFGSGALLLHAWAALRAHGAPQDQLDWVAVTRTIPDAGTLRRAALADPAMLALQPLVEELADAWPERIPGVHRRALDGGRVRLTLLVGDVHELLAGAAFVADAWNLHEEAGAELLAMVAQRAAEETTFAANDDALARGLKRMAAESLRAEQSRGHRRVPARGLPAWFAMPEPVHARTAVVVGAGLAGAAAARALAERGLRVHVLDALGPAQGASSAPTAVLAPHIASWQSPQTRIVSQAFLHARALMRRLHAPAAECGLLQPLRVGEEWGLELAIGEWGWPHDLLQIIDADEATAIAGVPLGALASSSARARPQEPASSAPAGAEPTPQGAVFTPLAGTTVPAATVEALLSHPGITVHARVRVDTLRRAEGGWALGASGDGVPGVPRALLACAPLVVLATAGAWTPRLADERSFGIDRAGALADAALPDAPLDCVRGQLSFFGCEDPHAASGECAPVPHAIVSGNGFVAPGAVGSVCVGATYERGAERIETTTRDDALNLTTLERLLPELAAPGRPLVRHAAWAGLRASVHDHCPIVGPVPDSAAYRAAFAPLRDGPLAARWPSPPTLPGLFVTLAHGSRGTSTALLCGELLADMVVGGVRCVPDGLLPALLPQRFLVRALRGGAAPM
ncbi:MAG: FAD-dependent 5-carboxymethylaminomethyl-2-thiouridine(34) oxidoreductase MnmC [Phycisphaerales bacterium]